VAYQKDQELMDAKESSTSRQKNDGHNQRKTKKKEGKPRLRHIWGAKKGNSFHASKQRPNTGVKGKKYSIQLKKRVTNERGGHQELGRRKQHLWPANGSQQTRESHRPPPAYIHANLCVGLKGGS